MKRQRVKVPPGTSIGKQNIQVKEVYSFPLHGLVLRACLHGGGGPQVGEVTRLGRVTRQSIYSLISILSLLHDRWGAPPHFTSPICGTPTPCKQALKGMSQYSHVSSSLTNKTSPLFCFPPILRPVDHQCVRFQASETRTLGSKTTVRVNKNSWSRE